MEEYKKLQCYAPSFEKKNTLIFHDMDVAQLHNLDPVQKPTKHMIELLFFETYVGYI